MASIKPVYSGAGKAVNAPYSGTGNRITRTGVIPAQVLGIIAAGSMVALSAANVAPQSTSVGTVPSGALVALTAEKATPQSATIGTIAAGGIESATAARTSFVTLTAILGGSIEDLSAVENVTIELGTIAAGGMQNVSTISGLQIDFIEYWPLDTDYANHNYPGTQGTGEIMFALNFAPWTAGIGINGGGLDASISTECAYLENDTDLPIDPAHDDVSFAFWIKLDALGEIFSCYGYGGDAFGSDTATIELNFAASTWTLHTESEISAIVTTEDVDVTAALPTVADGNWYHIVVTSDRDGNVSLYVNGSLAGTTSGSPGFNGISDFGLYGETYFGYGATGPVDEIAVWSRVLTATNVTEAYNAGAGGFEFVDLVADLAAIPSGAMANITAVNNSPNDFLSSLAHYWDMSETSGAMVDKKASANLNRSGICPSITGISGNGVNLASGSDKLVNASSPLTISPLDQDWSISLWWKATAIGDILNIEGANFSGSVYCRITESAGSYAAEMKFSSAASVDLSGVLPSVADNNWYHIVIAADWEGNTTVYVNGSQVGSPVNVGWNGVPASLTTWELGPGTSGVIDEVAIWAPRLLDSTDVSDLYNGGAGLFYPSFAGA